MFKVHGSLEGVGDVITSIGSDPFQQTVGRRLKGVRRHPVSYFLANHVSTASQAKFAKTEHCGLSDAGLKVRAFGADGLQANFIMLQQCGS